MYVRAGRPAFAQPCVGVHVVISFKTNSVVSVEAETLYRNVADGFWWSKFHFDISKLEIFLY